MYILASYDMLLALDLCFSKPITDKNLTIGNPTFLCARLNSGYWLRDSSKFGAIRVRDICRAASESLSVDAGGTVSSLSFQVRNYHTFKE